MDTNPFLGVIFHWIGGLASASFYIPYRKVTGWSWETYWLVGGVFSWIVAPLIFALLLVPSFGNILLSAQPRILFWTYAFGVLWGLGGLTFGLTMRYLGIALGMAVALGYCAAFGTLMPPIFNGEFSQIAGTNSGRIILLGVMVCLVGIVMSGLAGVSKERELTEEQKKAEVSEFNFVKGIIVATFSGIMSSCFAYGLTAGRPIAQEAKLALFSSGKADLWQNLPVLVVVLLGGFTTNFIWCLILNIRNKTGDQYWRKQTIELTGHQDGTESDSGLNIQVQTEREVHFDRVSLLSNYFFSAMAGVIWYLQFFFYGMGQTRMGKYDFSSWTLHMASIIIFSTLWGIALREWRGTSKRTHVLIGLGLATLIASTIIVGYGNFIKGSQ
jgi:L-rhamnose-H+ transport protein